VTRSLAAIVCFITFSLVLGCGEKEGEDTGWWLREAPDITGQYQFFVDGVSYGSTCEEELRYVTDWMPGALNISGDDPLALTFTFSDGMAFTGGVDSSWTYWFNGAETYDSASVAVSGAGSIFTDGDQRGISGSIEAEVDDDEFTTNNCIFEVLISGTRISG
jgi:hypothetical protein